MANNVKTFYWIVYFQPGAAAAGSTHSSSAAPAPSPSAVAHPTAVTVIHRDLYTTHTARFVLPRDSDAANRDFYRGGVGPTDRVKVFDFHPDDAKAIAWMDAARWTALVGQGAVYAELHSFEVSAAAAITGYPSKP